MPTKKRQPRKKTVKHRTKISQKVIQKVIVKIGEEKKAKKARRKYRRQMKTEEREVPQQPIIAPNVIYQTGQPYQAPPYREPSKPFEPSKPAVTITEMVKEIKPVSKLVEEVKPIKVAQDLTQLEDLMTTFIDPVAPPKSNEPLMSEIYTRPILPTERVEGNYAFGMPEKKSLISEVTSKIVETGKEAVAKQVESGAGEFIGGAVGGVLSTAAKAAGVPGLSGAAEAVGKTIGSVVGKTIGKKITGKESTSAETEAPKKTRRTKQEVVNAKREQLLTLLKEQGLTNEKAQFYSKQPADKDLDDQIKLEKLKAKAMKIKKSVL